MSARVWFIIVLLLAAITGGAYYLIYFHPTSAGHVLRFSGTIEATKVDVSFQISGRISELLVREGQPVKQGDVLARMSPDELNARVQQMQASLDSIVSQARQQEAELILRENVVNNQIRRAQGDADATRIAVERLREGSRPQEIKVAEAAVAQAEADLERRKSDFDRLSGLLQRGAISKQEYDAVREAYLSAQTNVNAARERLGLAKEGPRKADIAEAEARSRSAQAGVGIAKSGQKEIDMQKRAVESARAHERELSAELDAAKTQLGYTEIKSPIDGVVLLKNVENGEVVNPGTPVVTIGDIQNLWMNIYVPETQTGKVKLDQSVLVSVDAYPHEYFTGNVSFISSESEFTPKTIQTEEERVKLVYRVKVTLMNKDQRLKPGMPADAEISPVP